MAFEDSTCFPSRGVVLQRSPVKASSLPVRKGLLRAEKGSLIAVVPG